MVREEGVRRDEFSVGVYKEECIAYLLESKELANERYFVKHETPEDERPMSRRTVDRALTFVDKQTLEMIFEGVFKGLPNRFAAVSTIKGAVIPSLRGES